MMMQQVDVYSSGLQHVFFLLFFFQMFHMQRDTQEILFLGTKALFGFKVTHHNIIVYNGTSYLDDDHLVKSETGYGQSSETKTLCFSCLANLSFN